MGVTLTPCFMRVVVKSLQRPKRDRKQVRSATEDADAKSVASRVSSSKPPAEGAATPTA